MLATLLLFVAAVFPVGSERCNIPKVPIEAINGQKLLPDAPVIYTTHRDRQAVVHERSERELLLKQFGDTIVTLSSSNTYSHGKYSMTLSEYITTSVDTSSQNANESFYLFGNNYDGIFSELADLYSNPPCYYCDKAGAKTVGLGGHASGVSFHFHGPGFSEPIIGSKQWFLFPPSLTRTVSQFDPNMTVARWVDRVYPLLTAVRDGPDFGAAGAGEINHSTSLQPAITMEGVVPLRPVDSSNTAEEVAEVGASTQPSQLTALLQDMNMSMATLQQLADNLHECVIHPGEILYFPSMWMHATLNLDSYNVFMSLFMDPQLMKD
jgi:hypothetical protein